MQSSFQLHDNPDFIPQNIGNIIDIITDCLKQSINSTIEDCIAAINNKSQLLSFKINFHKNSDELILELIKKKFDTNINNIWPQSKLCDDIYTSIQNLTYSQIDIQDQPINIGTAILIFCKKFSDTLRF